MSSESGAYHIELSIKKLNLGHKNNEFLLGMKKINLTKNLISSFSKVQENTGQCG